MAKILKLERDDEEKERSFELDFLLSLTVEQRVALMLERSALLRRMWIENERPELPIVSKRK